MTLLAQTARRSMLQWPQVAVFGALPTVGLVAGPSYAGLIFGLGVVLLAHGIVTERRFPVIDRELGLIAVAFAMLCWASAAWSIDPARSLVSALDVTAILAGALVFLGGPPLADKTLERLFGVLVMATLLGAALVVADDVLGYPLQSLISGRPYPVAPTKYNRGIDYLVLIIWPQFAFVAYRGRWRDALSLAACVAVILAIGASLAGQVAALVGMLVLGLAFWLPRAAAPTCTAGMILLVAGLPFGLRLLAKQRTILAPFVKSSGLHRLEIWDYMTAHVFERPLLGWGIASSIGVPISQDEMSHYVVQHGQGIYPHNQWLQLWIETGALGAAIGLAFALLVVHRIQLLAAPLRPFAYAAFASAVTESCVNFEVTTDSWWAALAASGYLLARLGYRADPR
jgi:exopolysaccharide production protein ExoQ